MKFVLDGLGGAGGAAMVVEALKCLEKWSDFAEPDGFTGTRGLGFLITQGMLDAVLAGLGQQATFAAAAAVISALSVGQVSSEHLDAVSSRLFPTFVALGPTYIAAAEAGAEEWCSTFVVMVVAAAASLGDEIAKGQQSTVALFVVVCILSTGERGRGRKRGTILS
jgi:hypothetical protein